MKIDVLMCVHSQSPLHDRLLGRALESLVRQTYADFRTIVLLDECWEYTRSVVDKYLDVLDLQILEKHRKQTLSHAKNYGLKFCTGDWVMFLDADDYLHEEKIERQVDYISSHPEVDFLFCQAYDIHPDGTITDNCFKLAEFDTHSKIIAELQHQNCLHHGSACIRRQCLEKLGGYSIDLRFKGQEDYALWISAVQQGYQFFNLAFRGYYYSLGTSVER